MKHIANLLFEAKLLKELPRSGYHFLGTGKESVAEHCFSTCFIAYVMSRMEPEMDALKLISMSLIHDLAEARTGDLNAVNKRYVKAEDDEAFADAVKNLPFAENMKALIGEFKRGRSTEARLARDADQLALLLELKDLTDVGYKPPETWIPDVVSRLKTKIGKNLAHAILETPRDAWWKGVDTQ